MSDFRNRIVEFRTLKACDLRRNEKNWRLHPDAQKSALLAALDEIGYVGAVIARLLPDGTYKLLDGHLRADVSGEQEVPVLVVDVTDEEESLILATFDPLGAMAQADTGKLDALLRLASTTSEELAGLMTDVAERNGLYSIAEAEPPELADGDREQFQQMTFTLHDSQVEIVKNALKLAKAAGQFADCPNDNSNGNALARIAEAYHGAS